MIDNTKLDLTTIEPIATVDEVKTWLLTTLRHSCHVEYYLHHLNRGQNDPQRPHDICGPGNKFEWEVIKGLALGNRELKYNKPGNEKNVKIFREKYLLPSIDFHRQQLHHQRWNNPHPDAPLDEMEVGAVDAICSLLENREYQGGEHTFEEVAHLIRETHIPWARAVFFSMRTLDSPKIEQIQSLENFPNIGISEDMYQKTIERVQETLIDLRKKYSNL